MSNEIDFMRLVVAIQEYIHQGKVITFAQLQLALESDFKVYGFAGLAARANPKITFWAGMSEPFMRAIEWLLAEGEIRIEYISPILYFCDRLFLDLPPIDSQRIRYLLEDWDEYARIIEKPVWFPVVLTPKGITVQDLLEESITPALLQTVLDSADAGHIQRERFGQVVNSMAGAPFDGDDEGKEGEDNGNWY